MKNDAVRPAACGLPLREIAPGVQVVADATPDPGRAVHDHLARWSSGSCGSINKKD